ncbi:enzyme E2 Z [Seminavis robusta]|uniref:Ubiquitin-conjugating enzyme E2 Z n=1 Tax=Seminavis robusta TaxID=568900 RepID=A0A9N8DYJ2_9STRA|nr:enzyme E2 Z [Seminavis robusta]|eukprot:Sro391_g133240.1 enzyme E2 Z (335) ;mRNA; f:69308-70312
MELQTVATGATLHVSSDSMEVPSGSGHHHHHHHEELKVVASSAAMHHEISSYDNDEEAPLPKLKKLKLEDDDDSSFAFQNPTKQCLHRIHNDLTKLYNDPIEGIFVVPDDNLANRCHALLLGPTGTPYEFGSFYFIMDFPNSYPHEPPKVTIQTTDLGTVRFNPNIYACGKVCLSILGTWSGPSWTPALTIGSVLLSIQSLMNATPYHNEPGFESIHVGGRQPRNYNNIIRHETIRVAVLGMVELALAQKLPQKLGELIIETAQATKECCGFLCEEYKGLDGLPFQDPYKRNKGIFQFRRLQERLEAMGGSTSTNTNNEEESVSMTQTMSMEET